MGMIAAFTPKNDHPFNTQVRSDILPFMSKQVDDELMLPYGLGYEIVPLVPTINAG